MAEKVENAADDGLRNFTEQLYDGSGRVLSVSSPASPKRCCASSFWHPTHARIVAQDGTEYKWNIRQHRKLRYPEGGAESHPLKLHDRFRLVCWKPKIVTWYLCWIGVIANTLWVVNGVYATWPEQATRSDPEIIIYATGVVGAFLFIITGYLGYVEAINQTHAPVNLPDAASNENGTMSEFSRPHIVYGSWPSPLWQDQPGTQAAKEEAIGLLKVGYPIVQDVQSKRLLSARLVEGYIQETGSNQMEEAVVGREFDVAVGNHILRVQGTGWSNLDLSALQPTTETSQQPLAEASTASAAPPLQSPSQGYRWWASSPDFQYIGVVNALVLFISTIIFFFPATMWLSMSRNNAPKTATVFWIYILQMIASLGFVYVGHASCAEASGSWCKPKLDYIGWWIALFNTIGGYGFLLYAILATPSVVTPGCCVGLTKWGANLATFWGSCAFWIAGILSCIEFSSPHPLLVTNKKGN